MLAFVVRAIVAVQLGALPLYERPQLDSYEYWVWAQSIAKGEFLRWAAPSHGPGYAVFLAVLLTLLGGSLVAVAIAQGALGAWLCVLCGSLAARIFGDRRAGLASGVLLSLYGPLVYLEVSLFAEGLFTFLLVLALWLLTRGATGTGWALLIGALIGAAAVTRATALPFLPALLVLILLGRTKWPRRSAVWMTVAWLVVVAPVILLLRQTSGGWIPVQVFGGLNFYMGNHAGASGTPEGRLGGSWDQLYHEPTRHGITDAAGRERYFVQKALREIRTEPFGTIRAIGRKIVWFVQAEEVRDNYNFFRTQSSVLGLLPGFGLLLPFAAWGLWLAIRSRRLPLPVALFLLLFAASNILIVVSSRYRIPLVPLLAVTAGATIVFLVDGVRERRVRDLIPAGAVLLIVAAITRLWTHAPSRDFSEEWAMTASSLGSLGRIAEARAAAENALAANSESALAWFTSGVVRLREKDSAGAMTAFANAVRINPDYLGARLSLGVAYKQSGDLQRAEPELRHAQRIAPDDPQALMELGEVLLESGKLDEARALLTKLVTLDPQNERAWLTLARLEGAARNPKAGVEMASKASAINPSNAETWMLLTMLALDASDAATAERAVSEAEAQMGKDVPPTRFARALLARLRRDPAEADRILRALLRDYPGFTQGAQLFVANASEQGRRDEAEAYLRSLRPR